ncbi:MAG: hypothetical protein WD670_09310 [Actinomycetota bacterium]
MGTTLATGVPAWPTIGQGFDLSPLLMVLGAIVVARFLFGMELTGGAVGALVLGGTFTSWLADATGLLPAAGIGLLLLGLGSAWVRRSQPR